MSGTMRVFVAIELPEPVKRALAGVVEELRQKDIRGLRLARPEGIHLMLKFLGNVPVEQVDDIANAVTQAARGHAPFELALGSTGVFPNAERPRVLWVGVEGDMSPLLSLQIDVEDALEKLGFEREKRRFSPHLTIGRIREGTPISDRRKAAEALSSVRYESSLKIKVSAISLMKSTLQPDGAIYERLVSASF